MCGRKGIKATDSVQDLWRAWSLCVGASTLSSAVWRFSRHSRLLWELGALSGLLGLPVAQTLYWLPRGAFKRFHKLFLTDVGLPWYGGCGFCYIFAHCGRARECT